MAGERVALVPTMGYYHAGHESLMARGRELGSKLVVSGETNDVTSGPVTLTVNDSPVVVNEVGTFSTEVTLTEGENRITIKATDAAGKQTVITRTVYLDTNAPVFVSVSMTPNPVDCGATFILRVKATDD